MNDLAHKMAKEWLENNLVDYLNVIPYGKHAVEALANQMKFYFIEMTGGIETMTSKFNIKLAALKYERNRMATIRDNMREQLNEIEYEYDNFGEGIENIDIGIESLEAGIDQISEVV